MLAEIFVDAYRPENTGESWTVVSAYEVVQYWFYRSPEDLKILAVSENNEILGAFFADVKPWWDGPRLVDGEFFVKTNYQKQNIGTNLFIEILNRAVSHHNVEKFETITFQPSSAHPLKWYLSLGFKIEKDLVIINGAAQTLLDNLKKK